MDPAQRRRIRDFVALVIPTVWLFGIALFGIATGADLLVISALVGFAVPIALHAYQSRPRPMEPRVLRPIVMASLLLALATVASGIVARLGGDPYVGVGVALGLVVVTVLTVRSEVLKIIGPRPTAQRAEGWPIIAGEIREVRDPRGLAAVVLAHALFGSVLAWFAVALSTDAVRVLAAETLVVLMLAITLAYARLPMEDPDQPGAHRIQAGRDQLLLISWGLFGYMAFLVSVGTALSPPILAAVSFAFFTAFFILAASFLRWRRGSRSRPT